MNAIDIWEPRYKDGKVLVARYKIPAGQNILVHIVKGAYKGLYKVLNDDIVRSSIEHIKTRNGRPLEVRAIPLTKLIKLKETHE